MRAKAFRTPSGGSWVCQRWVAACTFLYVVLVLRVLCVFIRLLYANVRRTRAVRIPALDVGAIPQRAMRRVDDAHWYRQVSVRCSNALWDESLVRCDVNAPSNLS